MKYLSNILLIAIAAILSLESTAQVADKAEDISPLLVGEFLPDETLTGTDNKSYQLHDILKAKPAVLVFYRGGWCPYCNLQLSALAEVGEEVLKLGYQLVAISPDSYEDLQGPENGTTIPYRVFSDPGAGLIQQTGIAFKTKAITKAYIASKSKAKPSSILPVPTLLIVNTEGEILFEYINVNYKKRISPEMLLAVLKTIEE